MKSVLVLFFLFLAPPAWALQPVFVDQMGAKADGVARTDCSITSGSKVLICTDARFTAHDVGKVIAVYEAGPLTAGYRQPLSTTIASRQSTIQVTLTAAAGATADPSTRVVYGTDNTTVLQRVIDSTVAVSDGRGGNVGGTVHFGPGMYLVKSLALLCSSVGVWANGTCPRSYNNIALVGAGRTATELENWDISTTAGIFEIGDATTFPVFEPGNRLMYGIQISDMTIRQVAYGSSQYAKTVIIGGVTDSRFERLLVTGSSYECFYMVGGDYHVEVRDNYASGCGTGGPARPGIALSAYNIACIDCIFSRNTFDMRLGGSSYPAEIGFKRGMMSENYFACDRASTQNTGVQIGSANAGIYDMTVMGNTFNQCDVGVGNGSGSADRMYFLKNHFIDAALQVSGGLDVTQLGTPNFPETVYHSQGVVDGNTFVISGAVTSALNLPEGVLGIGGTFGNGYPLNESWLITNNVFAIRQTYCTLGTKLQCQQDGDCAAGSCALPSGFLTVTGNSGGTRWAPSTACNAGSPVYSRTYVFPVVYNGYYYKCTTAGTTGTTEPTWPVDLNATVSDGTAVWTNAGRKAVVTVINSVIQGPEFFGTYSAPNGMVSLRTGTDRDGLVIQGLQGTFAILIQNNTDTFNNPTGNETIPAFQVYSNYLQRYGTVVPTLGYFPVNAKVTNTAPSAGHFGWLATRAGRAGTAWATGTDYAFGAWVVASSDNGHAFTQRTPGGCTSHASTEPTWQTGAGALTTDNTCSWKESGAAVLWLEY